MEENDIGIPDEFKTVLEQQSIFVEAAASVNLHSHEKREKGV